MTVMEHHYVCSECGFTSKLAGTCQNDDCIKQGVRLNECHCEDGRHADVLSEPIENTPDKNKNGYSTNVIDLDNEEGK